MDYRDAPLITIGLVACNAKDTVERAVRSAVRQSYPSLDILVIDNASTDGTDDILDKMAQRHGDVRVIRNDASRGVAACRNQIIAQAHGAFIAFFDACDESLSQRLIWQYVRLTDYEDAFARDASVVCHTARLLCSENGKKRVMPTIGDTLGTPAPHGQAVAATFLMGSKECQCLAVGSQMARKSLYRKMGGFDETLAEGADIDFSIRLALDGAHFVGVSDSTVIQNDTQTRRKTEHAGQLAVMEKHRAFIETFGDFDFFRDWIQAERAWVEQDYATLLQESLALSLHHPKDTFARLKVRVKAIYPRLTSLRGGR